MITIKRKYDTEFNKLNFKIPLYRCFNCLCCRCNGFKCPKFYRYDKSVGYNTRLLNLCLRCLETDKKPVIECDYFLNKNIKRYKLISKKPIERLSIEQIFKLHQMLNNFIDELKGK